MKFEKGQWYQYKEHFWQYDDNCFRHAGDEIPVKNLSYANKLTPATLTPDFSNAKEGDKCFSAEDDFCIMLPCHDKHFVPAMNSNGGFDVFLPDGRLTAESKHPTLFNSYAQFMAYWREEALKLKGGESE